MATDIQETAIPEVYSVISIEKVSAPDGADGDDWYRYVVGRDNSTIVGNMRGTKKQVSEHARDFAENLNLRASTPNRRSPWTISPSQKTPPNKP